ncbi:hypothetical protein SODALDRAFT_330515 [Sodiomyces alkalinus F11]|uniref:Uncharacterized protein n=1 Tax=Sodiomyces alkalinus (strain CBS 110278 / VKM F-3762 / F11) TaxID=1314773 RepID=A0A3N2Q203_SODAK|nr:hypothetical protein SODALDRAFT_330515 [Sodiomyces alkalinus F11]ROT40777.1 hypothetical protein SODALDRAFT_330515 [Sodiomyces alkalinus F11]
MASEQTIRPKSNRSGLPSPSPDPEPLPAQTRELRLSNNGSGSKKTQRPSVASGKAKHHPSNNANSSEARSYTKGNNKNNHVRDPEWETYGPRLYTCPDLHRLRELNARMDFSRDSQIYGSSNPVRNLPGPPWQQHQQQPQQPQAMDPASLAREAWPLPPDANAEADAGSPAHREVDLWEILQKGPDSVMPEPPRPQPYQSFAGARSDYHSPPGPNPTPRECGAGARTANARQQPRQAGSDRSQRNPGGHVARGGIPRVTTTINNAMKNNNKAAAGKTEIRPQQTQSHPLKSAVPKPFHQFAPERQGPRRHVVRNIHSIKTPATHPTEPATTSSAAAAQSQHEHPKNKKKPVPPQPQPPQPPSLGVIDPSEDIYSATPRAAKFRPSDKFVDVDDEQAWPLRPEDDNNHADDEAGSPASKTSGTTTKPSSSSFRARAVENWSKFYHKLVRYDDDDGLFSDEEQQRPLSPGGCSTCSEDFRPKSTQEKRGGKGKEKEKEKEVDVHGSETENGAPSPVVDNSNMTEMDIPLQLDLPETGPSFIDAMAGSFRAIYARGAENSGKHSLAHSKNRSNGSSHTTRREIDSDSRSHSPVSVPTTSPLADVDHTPSKTNKGKGEDTGGPDPSLPVDWKDIFNADDHGIPASTYLDALTSREIEGNTPLHVFMLKSVQATQAAAHDIRRLRSALAAKNEQLAAAHSLLLDANEMLAEAEAEERRREYEDGDKVDEKPRSP